MSVDPYKRPPPVPTVALMTATGEVTDELGRPVDLDDFPIPANGGHTTRVFMSYDTARTLILEGKGEALCWNGEEIRWRHRRFEDGWKNRPSDVNVLKIPFPDDDAKSLRHLANWRDWLAQYKAVPVGTTGSAAWSLLRACIRHKLWLGMGAVPPLTQTLGGRQELGPAGAGTFVGQIEQLDMPAAYATELGNLPYGGRWFKASEFYGGKHGPEWWSQEGRPCFVRAIVRVPDNLPFGALPRRPRGRREGLRALLLGATYPRGVKLQGLWTWDEVVAAEAAGCRIVKVIETWGHLAGGEQPFLRWWEAIQEGRRMPGLAGHLAKMTGNALWGRFAMDSRFGRRTIVRRDGKGKHLDSRSIVFRGGVRPDHALAETVSGRIRARLFDFMVGAEDSLLSAHTDGAWTYSLGYRSPDGWRRKARASRLDLLDPQVLRYWPGMNVEPVAVFAGVPAGRSLASFGEAWKVAGFPE